ncbi:unnamed protein product [Cylindrotheca closterium]|uniref:Uncharacterized protein n=1 Tax=Cylindrotheca closterium TaxID=2856 RepID=A0AAD2CI46_9STRA|nr:unnamed protein product [Cylindrotheca closterium]
MQTARQDYISRLQEEEISCQTYESAKRQREMEEAKQEVHQYLYAGDTTPGGHAEESKAEEETDTEPVFRVMQGFDGTFYKVEVGENSLRQRKPRRRSSQTPSRPTRKSEDTYQLIRGHDGNIYRVKLRQQPKKKEMRPRLARSIPTREGIKHRTRASSLSSSFEESSSPIADEDVFVNDNSNSQINIEPPR